MRKSSKGITLIALIITIIILLILAGVTIAQLTESGLFDKAKQAEQESENAQIKEEITLGDYENKIVEYVNGSNRETVTISKEEYNMLKNANLYTETEKAVGTWVNKKTIYRKVILFSDKTLAGNTWNTVADVTDCNIEKLVHSEILGTQNISSIIPAFTQVDGTSLQVWPTGASMNSDGIIIEYTKTTDKVPTN